MPRFLFVCLGFFCTASVISAPVAGKSCSFNLVDVDGRPLTASDGVVTVLVLTRRGNAEKVRLVADRVPERCLGIPTSRMVSVILFQPTQNRAIRLALTSLMRHRLDQEGKQLQQRYVAKGLNRDARQDVYAIADFDDAAATQLGLPAGSLDFKVLVVSGNGTVLGDWNDVPSSEELSKLLP